MAGWNGSGTFSKTYSWVQDQLNGIKIRADRHDANDVDFTNGINNCLTKDGQNQATADLPMATFKHTNVGKATALNQYTTAEQVIDNELKYYVATGTNTYVITPSPAITAYAAGQSFFVNFTNGNTTAATININSLGAKALTKNVSTALASGDIAAGKIYEIVYDGTQFQTKDVTGDVTGQSSSVDSEIALFSGTGGKTIKRATGTGFVKVVSGVLQTPSAAAVTDLVSAATSGGVVVEAANGTDVVNFGAGNTANATFYGALSMNTTNKIVNLADPTSAQDAATKAYVDANSGDTKTTTTASASANITFSSLDFANNTYEFHFANIVPATDASNFQIDLSENNFSTSADCFVFASGANAGVATFISGQNKNLLVSVDNAQTLPYLQISGSVYLSQLVTGVGISGTYLAQGRNSGNTGNVHMSGNISSNTNPATFYNAVRFQMSAGNLTSGSITMVRKPIS